LENYFNYFTEIEERFQQRRGSILLLSTLDWALIETWREAGIPLSAVLRGIDAAFDRYDARKARARRINGLAWCAQEVMTAAEDMREAMTGAAKPEADAARAGLEQERIANYLEETAAKLRSAEVTGLAAQTAAEIAERLDGLANSVREQHPNLEELERMLTAREEKLLSAVTATASEEELAALREQSAQEIAPYRRRMQALQIRQIEQQFLQKRLLEQHEVPRLSLFYMRQD
jgi:phage terminase Nu1 subunit (DNA packaging protein)